MSFGFFVEMDNTVEGLVPVHTLANDFYDYDEDTMTLKGQTHGKVFQMGMRVRVVCTDVQREKGQVTFSLLERKIMIKGIHHVAFKCETQEQYDEMIYFYHELLELPILRKWNTGIHLDCFNSCIEIF